MHVAQKVHLTHNMLGYKYKTSVRVRVMLLWFQVFLFSNKHCRVGFAGGVKTELYEYLVT